MIVFYVSGHGYGHAARIAAVIEALSRKRPDLRVAVRTQASRLIFPKDIEYHHVEIDSAVIESPDALVVDNRGSVAGIRNLLGRRDEIIDREARFLAGNHARVIAADIPFLAGEIARRAGLPGVAMSNFLWDWIFDGVAEPDILEAIRRGYSGLTEALRYPLSHREGWGIFDSVTDVPLVTPRSTRPRETIRRELGISDDPRPTVLIGGRARLTGDVIEHIRRSCPEFLFLSPEIHPSFSDLLRGSDIVVGKLGYSIAAECIAENKKLLFPPREGFREEAVLIRELPRYLSIRPIPPCEWAQGNWGDHLHALLESPPPHEIVNTNGAEVCANRLITVNQR